LHQYLFPFQYQEIILTREVHHMLKQDYNTCFNNIHFFIGIPRSRRGLKKYAPCVKWRIVNQECFVYYGGIA